MHMLVTAYPLAMSMKAPDSQIAERTVYVISYAGGCQTRRSASQSRGRMPTHGAILLGEALKGLMNSFHRAAGFALVSSSGTPGFLRKRRPTTISLGIHTSNAPAAADYLPGRVFVGLPIPMIDVSPGLPPSGAFQDSCRSHLVMT
jgi:hypothetical protein